MAPFCSNLWSKEINQSMVKVSGKCKQRVPTDRSRLEISVENAGSDLDDLYSKTISTYEKILKDIKGLKLKHSSLETSSYQVKKEYDWNKGKRVFRGHKVSISLSVTSSETKKMTKIISMANQLNITNVRGLYQFVSDKTLDQIKADCLQKAVLDAQNKASSMAQALGRKLGGHFYLVEGLQEDSQQRPQYRTNLYAMKSMSSKEKSGPTISQGYRTFNFFVTGEFVVK
jgi:uncharacterized protein YggE